MAKHPHNEPNPQVAGDAAPTDAVTPAKPFVLPEGFTYATEKVSTKALDKDVSYDIEYAQAGSLDALRAMYAGLNKNADELILRAWNELQKQRATQGGKTKVRGAENDGDLATAISAHQTGARTHILWSRTTAERKPGTRTRIAGFTKAKREEFGTRMLSLGRLPTLEDYQRAAFELGASEADFAELHIPFPSEEQQAAWTPAEEPATEEAAAA